MIILDNIIFNLQKAGGISVVWQNLIKYLLTFTNDIKFLEYPVSDNISRKKINIPLSDIIIQPRHNSIVSQFHHPKINRNKPFIFHSSYFRTCKNINAKNVTTVHDFIYEQGRPSLKQKIRIWINYRAIRKSDAIVCISENTRKDLFKYLPDIDPKKVHVIYNGVSEEYKLLDKEETYKLYKDYILFVGGRQEYKNFDFLINGLKDTNYKLLICGKPLSITEIKTLEQCLPNKYKSIVFPSNEDLNIIYNSVYALVYPSSYEGFGLPILEAQSAGCPVIAYNSSSIPEIIGDTSFLLKELSKEELISKLDELKDSNTRQSVIRQGLNNSRRFSWKKMAEEYFNLYNQLLAQVK